MTEGLRTAPRLLAEMSRIYDDDSADAGRLRAALLAAVLRLTPAAMAANMGCALIIVWAFAADPPAGIGVWAASMLGLAAVALRAWWRGRARLRQTASRRAVRRATLHAGMLAAAWAVVPLAWFAGAAAHQQVQVAVVVTGLMGAGAFMLSPLPRACLAYLGIYSVAAVGALLLDGNPAHTGIALMLAFYASVLAAGALAAGNRHIALLRVQAETARQKRMLALLLQDFEQHADEALWQTDARGLLTHASPRLAELLGCAGEAVEGRPLLELLDQRGADDDAGREALKRALAELPSVRDLPLRLSVAGRARHLTLRAKRIFGDDGHAEGWRGVLADVTERVLAQERLQRLAHTDPLTGLANRLTLRDSLVDALRQGRRGALLLLDLDDFKHVNDEYGHGTGDGLLRAVAQRLRETLRPGDLVARLGGDEFAVLMQRSARDDDAEALAARLIGAVALPFDLQGRPLQVGASVGVAPFGAAAPEPDALFEQADMALYAAKEAGRGRHAVYSAALGERSRRRRAIEQGLAQALQRGELELHWQPRVDLTTWHVVGAEALLRWNAPGLGNVAPAELVAVAERCGLIEPLGRFVLTRACAEAAGPLSGPLAGGLPAISVNVSPVQLRQAGFVELVRDALHDCGLQPARLELDVTEALFADAQAGTPQSVHALQTLHALRELGVRVALDDFGRGHSSLACLRRFPFDTLKIDPGFAGAQATLDGAHEGGHDDAHEGAREGAQEGAHRDARILLHTLSRLARTLRMRTVCEGVETNAQLATVAAAGCEQVQGHLAARPLPLAQFCELLRQWPLAGRPSLLQLSGHAVARGAQADDDAQSDEPASDAVAASPHSAGALRASGARRG